jgi:hypothetical protein
VIGESSTAEGAALRRAALNARHRAVTRRHSDADLVRAVREVSATLGRPPTGREYARLAAPLRLPALATIQRRLGWSSALQAAGLTARPDRGSRQRWDRESCLRAALTVAGELGRPPSIREYDRASRGRPELPSPVTVAQRFDGWAQVRLAVARYP